MVLKPKAPMIVYMIRLQQKILHKNYLKKLDVFNASIALKKADVLLKLKKVYFVGMKLTKAKIYCGMYLGATIFPGWYYLYDLKNPEEVLKLDREGFKGKFEGQSKIYSYLQK